MKLETIGPVLTLAAALACAPAWAQAGDPAASASAASAATDDDDDDSGEEVELEPDEIDPDEFEPEDIDALPEDNPEGSGENPNLIPEFGEERPVAKKVVPIGDLPYPKELALRPLVLKAGMSQVSFDLLTNVDDFFVTGLAEARYGATHELQIALAYGIGAVSSDGFTAGKALSIEAQYAIAPWIAAQLEIPFLLDPFSLGLTIGAPMKFRFGQRLAFTLGQDLLNFKIKRFVPIVGDPLANQALADQDAVNTELDDGELRLLGGVIYQYSPELALFGEIGILAQDFGLTDAGVPLLVTVTYSSTYQLDLGARIGFRNLDNASENFGATLLVAYRM